MSSASSVAVLLSTSWTGAAPITGIGLGGNDGCSSFGGDEPKGSTSEAVSLILAKLRRNSSGEANGDPFGEVALLYDLLLAMLASDMRDTDVGDVDIGVVGKLILMIALRELVNLTGAAVAAVQETLGVRGTRPARAAFMALEPGFLMSLESGMGKVMCWFRKDQWRRCPRLMYIECGGVVTSFQCQIRLFSSPPRPVLCLSDRTGMSVRAVVDFT